MGSVGPAVVVIGVSGSGKSTLGLALADALGVRYVDGDTLHPAANVAKMAAGVALGDDDRRPFLARVARVIAEERPAGIVVSCSALKRAYRELIRAGAATGADVDPRAGEVTFVLPVLDRDDLAMRVAQRTGHFMPASLLDSQLADFEPPGPDEGVVLVDGAAPTAAQVAQVVAALTTSADAADPAD